MKKKTVFKILLVLTVYGGFSNIIANYFSGSVAYWIRETGDLARIIGCGGLFIWAIDAFQNFIGNC